MPSPTTIGCGATHEARTRQPRETTTRNEPRLDEVRMHAATNRGRIRVALMLMKKQRLRATAVHLWMRRCSKRTSACIRTAKRTTTRTSVTGARSTSVTNRVKDMTDAVCHGRTATTNRTVDDQRTTHAPTVDRSSIVSQHATHTSAAQQHCLYVHPDARARVVALARSTRRHSDALGRDASRAGCSLAR